MIITAQIKKDVFNMHSHKTALITINIGFALQKMATMTIPAMRAYADRISADFVVIDKIPASYQFDEYSAYWAKFILKDYLKIYDRIIYFDLDTVVLPHCPNLFQIVPIDSFAALIEDDYGNDLSNEINEIQRLKGDIGWKKGYFNVGVMVISKQHSGLFEFDKNTSSSIRYPEQTLINYNFQQKKYKIFKFTHRFNHLRFLNVTNHDRHHSYISHYAGIPQRLREAMIQEDLRRLSCGEPLLDEPDMEGFLNENFSDADKEIFKNYELLKDDEVFNS